MSSEPAREASSRPVTVLPEHQEIAPRDQGRGQLRPPTGHHLYQSVGHSGPGEQVHPSENGEGREAIGFDDRAVAGHKHGQQIGDAQGQGIIPR